MLICKWCKYLVEKGRKKLLNSNLFTSPFQIDWRITELLKIDCITSSTLSHSRLHFIKKKRDNVTHTHKFIWERDWMEMNLHVFQFYYFVRSSNWLTFRKTWSMHQSWSLMLHFIPTLYKKLVVHADCILYCNWTIDWSIDVCWQIDKIQIRNSLLDWKNEWEREGKVELSE